MARVRVGVTAPDDRGIFVTYIHPLNSDRLRSRLNCVIGVSVSDRISYWVMKRVVRRKMRFDRLNLEM
jgi:hypothetical protein